MWAYVGICGHVWAFILFVRLASHMKHTHKHSMKYIETLKMCYWEMWKPENRKSNRMFPIGIIDTPSIHYICLLLNTQIVHKCLWTTPEISNGYISNLQCKRIENCKWNLIQTAQDKCQQGVQHTSKYSKISLIFEFLSWGWC